MVHRKALVAGVFLAAAGGVMLAGQASPAARETIIEGLGLWPLALIAIGAGLLLRRTRAGIAGVLVAAAVPGLLLGGLTVAAPTAGAGSDCIRSGQAATTTRTGSFTGGASVELDLVCGDLVVVTTPGSAWSVDTLDLPRAAVVTASEDRLAVVLDASDSRWRMGSKGDRWRIALPTEIPLDLRTELSAGRGRLDLAGARIGDLALQVNAGEARLDLTDASVTRLDVEVRAGAATVLLPGGSDLAGDLSVMAGSLEICAPASLGIRIDGEAALGSTEFNGLVRANGAWETPGYSTSAHQAVLSVSASAGSVVLNPVGGCK
jgi:hypothetical protein